MKIITPSGTTDTTKDSVVLMFNNDDDLSSFISLLVNIPVKTTGIRVLPLVPSGKQLSPLTSSIAMLMLKSMVFDNEDLMISIFGQKNC